MTHNIVSHDEWITARLALLDAEKALTRQRDALTRLRQQMPWEKVDKDYHFTGPQGRLSFADLFAGHSQLLIYHFMLGPDWEEGCKSCSFWADNFNGTPIHLAHRDVAFTAVSRAPIAKIEAYRQRMGWDFPWVSSHDSDFNLDYQISFTPEQIAADEAEYNYAMRQNSMSELPGVSVFVRDDAGQIYHSYSCYARGLDMLNGAYHYLDLVPKGRDEADLDFTMGWVQRHDQYGADYERSI
jgi:predicted dithiol-disulfide oxidoreductase (DUF899 family)